MASNGSPVVSRRCRHCGMNPVQRPRGLCWKCYLIPGLRLQYPSLSKFGAWADRAQEETPLPVAGICIGITDLAARAARGLPLFG
jgi:hypothetical protein